VPDLFAIHIEPAKTLSNFFNIYFYIVLGSINEMPMRTVMALVLIALLSINYSYSQVSSATLQAVFLYQSIKYLEWPSDEFPNFEILVVGEGEIFQELLKIAKSRKVGSKSIVVKQVKSLSSVPLCHIVIFTGNVQAESLINTINAKPILLVTNTDGLLEKGSDLNFIKKGDKLSYQLNATALQEKKIKVSSSFSAMAEKII
jgi:YfiR/HmsC-like